MFRLGKLDEQVIFSLIHRAWTILAGAILVILIPLTLTQDQQGYYFTFSSLLATQVFFELGLNTVFAQMAAHEMAFLKFSENQNLAGPEKNAERLRSLLALTKRIYFYIGLLFAVFCFIAGFIFFKSTAHHESVTWQPAWTALVFFSALNLFLSPFLAILEGIGFVAQIAKLRILQSLLGYSILAVFLFMGLGLNAVVVPSIATFLISAVWILKTHGWVFKQSYKEHQGHRISWKTDIFPFQWRIAISWLCGYFIFQLFTPVIFKGYGAADAGRVGLALAVFTSITALSFSWVNAKSPLMANLAALGKHQELQKLFWNVLMKSTALNFLACLSFISLILVLNFFGISIANRVPELSILILIAITTLANHFIFSAAALMRAHKVEPMLPVSIASALLIAISVLLTAKLGLFVMFATYAGINVFIVVPWTGLILKRFLVKQPT